jgi:hypothetical protein
MRFWLVIGALVLVGAGFYWIWSDVNGLLLIENAKDGYYHSYYITDDGKTKTALSFNFLAGEQEIYKYLAVPFTLVFLVSSLLGGVAGYFLRKPIDGYDFEQVKKDAEAHKNTAWEEANKAKATLKTAETRARNAANEALEAEKQALEFHKAEAEKERIAAIQAQQAAEAAIRKAQIERTDALRIADNATRKKNAAYSAAERFKRKAEKTKA